MYVYIYKVFKTKNIYFFFSGESQIQGLKLTVPLMTTQLDMLKAFMTIRGESTALAWGSTISTKLMSRIYCIMQDFELSFQKNKLACLPG